LLAMAANAGCGISNGQKAAAVATDSAAYIRSFLIGNS
jgi:hypothetical protein